MKKKEQLEQLSEMTVEELKDQADALKESLFRLKFRKTLGVGEVIKDIRREKKTLARVYTLLGKKESEAKSANAEFKERKWLERKKTRPPRQRQKIPKPFRTRLRLRLQPRRKDLQSRLPSRMTLR
jgi:ribosomal protein L29